MAGCCIRVEAKDNTQIGVTGFWKSLTVKRLLSQMSEVTVSKHFSCIHACIAQLQIYETEKKLKLMHQQVCPCLVMEDMSPVVSNNAFCGDGLPQVLFIYSFGLGILDTLMSLTVAYGKYLHTSEQILPRN